MNICPVCKALVFSDETHKCSPRWVALADESDASGDKYVSPDQFTIFDDIYAADLDEAAAEAGRRFAAAARGYDEEGSIFVGVTSYDEYQQWQGRKVVGAPGSPAVPAYELNWFEVECVFSVRYMAHEIRNG